MGSRLFVILFLFFPHNAPCGLNMSEDNTSTCLSCARINPEPRIDGSPVRRAVGSRLCVILFLFFSTRRPVRLRTRARVSPVGGSSLLSYFRRVMGKLTARACVTASFALCLPQPAL